MYTVHLPGVLHEQHLQEQIGVVLELVRIRKANLPQQLSQDHPRELWILPGAVLQKLHGLLGHAGVLDELLHVAGPVEQNLGSRRLDDHRVLVVAAGVAVGIRLGLGVLGVARLGPRGYITAAYQDAHHLVQLGQLGTLVLYHRTWALVYRHQHERHWHV